ncbi:DRAP deaminase [Mortierella claussenii]|nr:DRAP deaminase [Mortierella claussenii]
MASSASAMKVLSKEDKDAAMHIHFMKLAIEQANMSVPVESGYCVGAVLVQESFPDPDSDMPQEDRFRVVTTGFSRELPGNTHAEECCLLKLATLQAQQEEKEREFEEDAGVDVEPPLKAAAAIAVAASGKRSIATGNSVGADAEAVSSHTSGGESQRAGMPRRVSIQYQQRHPHREHKKEWIMYSTMEPCSTRLSGHQSCSDRLIKSGVRRVYVGVREPDHFVKNVVGVENMVKQGIDVVHIPGLEEQCLAPNRHVLRQ